MIRQILNNEVYIGNMVQGKITKLKRKFNTRVKTKKENWIIVENTHEPIINKEDFEDVQRILNYSPVMLKSDDLLLRYLKYPDCGSKFYKKTKYNEYYYCNNYRKKECTNHSIIKSILEEMVLEELKSQTNKDIKELLENCLISILKSQEDTYNLMVSLGYYNVKNIDKNVIKTILEEIKNKN